MHMFFSYTIIIVGNGNDTPFWDAKWPNGFSPKDLAPNLFKVATYKKRSMKIESHDSNWIRNLTNINTTCMLEEFTLLFMALASVQLSEQRDVIV
jgi:hypothetical protein